MHADRGIKVWVSCSHDGRSSTASGEAGNVYSARLDEKVPHYAACYPCNEGRFAAAASLVAAVKPVPTSRRVGRLGLLRIGNEEHLLFSTLVHPRAGSEVVG